MCCLEGSSAVVCMSVKVLRGAVFHSCLHTFHSSCYSFWTNLNMSWCTVVIICLSSAFLKQLHSMYIGQILARYVIRQENRNSERSGHEPIHDPAHGTKVFRSWKMPHSYQHQDSIHKENTVCSHRPKFNLQPFSLFPSVLPSSLFCLFVDPFY